MKNRIYLIIFSCLLAATLPAQVKRYDSSMKVGKAGYRVYTNNKNDDRNNVTISPIGFNSNSRDVTIEVRGRVTKSEVDDLNRDGFPDLVMYVSSGGAKNASTVIGIASQGNESLMPIIFPDIVDDPKLRVGYMGQDQFFLMNGVLMRKFPLYETADTLNIKPSGMMRQIMYSVVPGEKGGHKFKVNRSYDFAKQ